jgi:hypothetical protein
VSFLGSWGLITQLWKVLSGRSLTLMVLTGIVGTGKYKRECRKLRMTKHAAWPSSSKTCCTACVGRCWTILCTANNIYILSYMCFADPRNLQNTNRVVRWRHQGCSGTVPGCSTSNQGMFQGRDPLAVLFVWYLPQNLWKLLLMGPVASLTPIPEERPRTVDIIHILEPLITTVRTL